MEVKQNATLSIVKGDNTHVYHVPPAASLPEVYDCLREMVAYVYDRLKQDFEKMQADQAPGAQAQPAPVEASVEVPAQPQE
jgi:hypothetical protein